MSNKRQITLPLICLICSMLMLSFAAVPIYSLFCKVTGFGGTTQTARSADFVKKGIRNIQINFDANVDPDLPWRFVPKQRSANITTGENNIVFYEVENLSDEDIIGTSIYNVTPLKAGKYFVKIHCFCFEEQLIKAKSKQLLPVSFYIDPDFDNDKYMEDIDTITLSYRFFKIRSGS